MLITFEGIDGSGKTTQIERLAANLEKHGYPAVTFREPGGTEVSEKIRSLLLDPEYEVDSVTELLLFSAARSQLMVEKVLPLLDEGKVVILDRFFDSTTAYQGHGRQQMNLEDVIRLNKIASHRRSPDLTFYLELSLSQARSRVADAEGDRMEQSGDQFYKRVIQGFEELARQHDRFVTMDATQPKNYLEQQIWDQVRHHL